MNLLCMFLFFAIAAGVSPLQAAETPQQERKTIDRNLIERYTAIIEIDYVIPRPSTILQVLEDNKFAFTGQVKPNETVQYKGGAKIALNLGSRCADGVMMVYGEQKTSDAQLEKLGQTIIKLMEDLGLKDKLKEVNKLKEALKTKNHELIRKSVDNLFAETENFLRQRDDNALAMFASLGGWIELTYYASEELSKNYQPESSKVLAMDYVIESYIMALAHLKLWIQDSPVLQTISKALPKLKGLMTCPPNQPLSQEAINGVYAIAKSLKHEIEKP